MKTDAETKKYVYVCAILFAFFTITTIYYPYISTADLWDHAPAVKELGMNMLHPMDSKLNLDVDDPRYNPYIFTLALMSKITSLDNFAVMKLAGLLNLALFMASLYLLMTGLFRDRKLPLYALITLIFFWGFGWNLTSSYSFKQLLFVLPYPSFFSFSLSLLALYFVSQCLEKGRQKHAALALALGLVIFLTHFQTFTFFYASSVLMALFHIKQSMKKSIISFIPFTEEFRKEKILLLIMPLIFLALSFLWPYYSFYRLFILVSSLAPWTAQVGDILLKTGPLLIVGIPVWMGYWKDKRLRFPWWAFLACASVFTVFYFFRWPVQGERYFFYMSFYLQILIAVKLNELGVLSMKPWKDDFVMLLKKGPQFFSGSTIRKNLLRWFLAAVLLLAIAFQLVLVGSFYYKYCNGMIDYRADVSDYSFLKTKVNAYDVVLADPETSFIIPSINGRAVGFYINHINPFVPDYAQRSEAIEKFFSASTSNETRQDIIEKYNVSYILVNFRNQKEDFYSLVEGYGKTAHKDRNFALIKIDKKA